MVHIEREVPGKMAERICAAPIQTACGRVISSMCIVRGRVKTASTIHMMIPPMRSASAITQRFSRFLPICFAKAHARHSCDDKRHQCQAQWMRQDGAISAFASWKCADELPNAVPKIYRQCQHRTELNDNRVHFPETILKI